MNKRIVNLTMFDFLKGLGIIMVLFRHSIYDSALLSESNLWPIIYTVLMPVFFVTSGYWLKKRPFRHGLTTSLKLFLKPYLIIIACIDLVGLIHRFLQNNMEEWVNLFLHQSVLVISGDYSRIAFMWFVFALMVGWILFYGLIQIKNEKNQIAVSFLLCFIGTLILPYKLPFQIAQGLIAQLFLFAGYLMKKHRFLEKKLSIPVLVGLAAIWLVGGYFSCREPLCDLSMYQFGNGIPAVLCCLCGSILVIEAGIRINVIDNPLIEKVALLGRYTMWILCIHSFEATVVPWSYIYHFVPIGGIAGSLLKFCLRCLFIFVVFCLIKHIMRRKKNA